MSQETLSGINNNSEVIRLRRLKRMIDKLISLAEAPEDDVAEKAAEIIEEIRNEAHSPVVRIKGIGELAHLSSSYPDEPQLRPLIDNTAEYLLEEIADYSPAETKNLNNLHTVWAGIDAWNISRSESSAKLCTTLLDKFYAAGQPQLVRAYQLARDNNIDFHDALDTVNAAMPMEEVA